jgi:hypothetical protein
MDYLISQQMSEQHLTFVIQFNQAVIEQELGCYTRLTNLIWNAVKNILHQNQNVLIKILIDCMLYREMFEAIRIIETTCQSLRKYRRKHMHLIYGGVKIVPI